MLRVRDIMGGGQGRQAGFGGKMSQIGVNSLRLLRSNRAFR
ncbi:MAG: hypothetical protein V7761_12025 [Amylibacter sp.]